MPALNYADDFAPLDEANTKRQTIRALRKHPIKRGDPLYHFHGMRHPGCRRLGYSIAEVVQDIDIFAPMGRTSGKVFIDVSAGNDSPLSHRAVEQLAMDDGFESIDAFFGWFVAPPSRDRSRSKDFHFMGQLIKWPTSWRPCEEVVRD